MFVKAFDRQLLFISFLPWQKAVKAMFLNKALPIHENGAWMELADWVSISHSNTRYINTINFRFPIPDKIVFYKATIPVHFKVRLSRWNLYVRDMGTCQYCGKLLDRRRATRDHVIPVSKGGRSTWNNLVLCCRDCNERKGSSIWTPNKKPTAPSVREIMAKMTVMSQDIFKKEVWNESKVLQAGV